MPLIKASEVCRTTKNVLQIGVQRSILVYFI